ncbi:MAG: PAS domain S-box protein, partial [Pseudomonadota bacterium]|nr:PAS domain S-box protein [Pseudomonadota bacterium]
MKNNFISLTPNPPAGFTYMTPSKHDLLGGRVSIYADAIEDATSLIDNFTKRIHGIIITRSERFFITALGPALWHIGAPRSMIDDLAGIATGYLDMLSYGQSALDENEHFKLELAHIEKTRSQLTEDYNKNVQRLGEKVDQLRKEVEKRKQAEGKLAAEKERLAVTLRSIGDAVITTDIEGKIVLINKVAEDLTGWSNEDARGKRSHDVFSIVNEKTGQKCASPVSRVLEFGRIVGLANHTALITKNGTQISIADSGAPIRDKESKIIGVVIVFRDITHERKIEEELIKIKKLESVGVLAGGIAHDFNNILAAILGNIELASLRVEDDEATSLLAEAQKATRRATKLTQQLLTFSKGGDPVKEKTSLSG